MAKDDDALPQGLAALRQNSVGRLLMRASRLYNEAAIEGVRAQGHPDLTIFHAAVLPHVDIDGVRLGQLAQRAGMTKQSASQAVGDLERLGYLRREADPDDRRSQRVAFTDRGRDFLRAAFVVKTRLESLLDEALGPADAAAFHPMLQRLVAHLDEDGRG